jgi:uncharacterized protein (DUF2141 family)
MYSSGTPVTINETKLKNISSGESKMIKWYGLIFLLIAVIPILLAGQETEKYGNLIVVIEGIENNNGHILIALKNSEENYEAEGQAFRGATVAITDLKASYTFEKIPYGLYALKIFHDEDSDKELDKNFLGLPTENYGFSNNARGSFGPASWEDAKFNFEVQIDTLWIGIE